MKTKKLCALILALAVAFSCMAVIPFTASAATVTPGGVYMAKLNYTSADSWVYMQTEMGLDAGTYQFDVDYVTSGSVTARVNIPSATVNSTTNENGHITVNFTWAGSGNFQIQLRDNNFSGTGIIYFAKPVLKLLDNGVPTGDNKV